MKKSQTSRERTEKLQRKKQVRIKQLAMAGTIFFFFTAVLFFAVLGLLLPLRPKTSEIEKRTLTAFPKPTVSTVLNGAFFHEIDTWYADTFPMREQLLSANAALNELHGYGERMLVSSNSRKGEDIPTEGNGTAGQTADSTPAPQESTGMAGENAEDSSKSGQDGSIREAPSETVGDVYITRDRAFELFYFVQSYADRYCKLVNTVAERVGASVTVYDMVPPVNCGIILDEKIQKELGCSDEKEAANYIFQHLNPSVRTVDVFDNIKQHNDEYVYFRTDHHWTARGAYYAYEEFCKVKGIKPQSLDSFQTAEYPGFLGTFYSDSQSSVLKENADTVVTYLPKGTNEMSFVDRDGKPGTCAIVADVSDYQKNNLYCAFSGADMPYNEIHNPQKTDGSSILIFKESYANAFIPFLVDHYQDIYFIDYRYYQGDWLQLVKDKQIREILFLNNVNAVYADRLLGFMEQMIGI